MGSALMTGVTGLIAHRRMLDVVGNNLANVNSVGYKSQRALFTDLFYETVRAGSSGSSNFIGGINPSQIGSGVKIGQIDRNFNQGSLELTGGEFDFAIQGNGFFVVDSGDGRFFSRSGAFAVDANQRLVDPASGYAVQRIGTVGEPVGDIPGFQVPGENGIRIPFGATIPGERTTSIDISGNLNINTSPPTAAVVSMNNRFLTGGAAATAGTLLNNLDSVVTPYGVGDTIELTGRDVDGSDVSTTLNVDGTTTLGDLVSAIDSTFAGASPVLDANGQITLTADTVGATTLALEWDDGAGNVGELGFDQHVMGTTTVGTDAKPHETAVEFVDTLGRSHTLRLDFIRTETDHTWDIQGSVDPLSGSLVSEDIAQLRFDDQGAFQQVVNTGTGSVSIAVNLTGISEPQLINLNFGTPNSYDGITQQEIESSTQVDADGFPAGTLTSVSVAADGIVNGIASNGRVIAIAQLAIASFANNKGLEAVGDSYYIPSANSGQVQMGTAQSGGRGRVTSGHLESSNVDTALEFTRLITAQRGFSANARTITVADKVLQELSNIIR